MALAWFGVLLEIMAGIVGTVGKQLIRYGVVRNQKRRRNALAQDARSHAESPAALVVAFAEQRVQDEKTSAAETSSGPAGQTTCYAAGKPPQESGPQRPRRPPGRFSSGAYFMALGLFLTTVVGPILDLAAYTFAPQSMIAPFSGMEVIMNTMLAPFTLGERLTRPKTLAIAVVATGVFSTLFFVDPDEPDYTLPYIESLVFSYRTGLYLVLFLAFILVNLRAQRIYPQGDNRRGLSLGLTGGSLAGMMFCVKLIGEIVEDCASGSGEFVERLANDWLTEAPALMVCLVLGLLLFSISNVFFMAAGMKEFEALYMVTLYEGSLIVSGSLCGTVVMKDFDGSEWYRPVGFFACVLLIVFGLYLLFVAQMRATSSLFNKTASIRLSVPPPASSKTTTEDDSALLDHSRELQLAPPADSAKADDIQLVIAPPDHSCNSCLRTADSPKTDDSCRRSKEWQSGEHCVAAGSSGEEGEREQSGPQTQPQHSDAHELFWGSPHLDLPQGADELQLPPSPTEVLQYPFGKSRMMSAQQDKETG